MALAQRLREKENLQREPLKIVFLKHYCFNHKK